jgi:type 2A phosphatase activator TIP41
VFESWATDDDDDEMIITVKQITAWMEKSVVDLDSSKEEEDAPTTTSSTSTTSWILLHLHETYVEGHGPPVKNNEKEALKSSSPQAAAMPTSPWNQSPPSPSATTASGEDAAAQQPHSIPSRRRHVSTDLEKYKAKPLVWNGHLVGISIAGWDIGTSQGPIGDATWFQQALETLEPMSQYKLSSKKETERKLVLPEMVFPVAHVVLERRSKKNKHGNDLFVSWDAMDALKEWAEAHQAIPLPSSSSSNNNNNATTTTTSIEEEEKDNTEATPSVSFRGVSVLQSSDATLWKRKQQDNSSSSTESITSNNNIAASTVFHYDWTYSTPFCGKVYGTRVQWKSLPKSGMPMNLLTDQSVPILYFDHLVLVEDDLHDTGQMQYICKVRVMPTCAYILSQLLVRVDHVVVRVRECRLLVDFGAQTMYRDVTWRECPWHDLAAHGLPTEVRAWTSSTEAPAFMQLLSKLPTVDSLPRDLLPYAKLSYATTN